MAENEASLKDTIRNLMENRKRIRLTINEDKTNYMVVTGNNHSAGHLDIGDNKFQTVDNFKYLGVDIKTNSLPSASETRSFVCM